MGDLRVIAAPLKWCLVAGQMSPQHLLTGAASLALPCILSVLRACCHSDYSSNTRNGDPQVGGVENNEDQRDTDDSRDNNHVGLLSLTSFHPVPRKHLIFALLLICAPLLMSTLFTFAAAQFTCCCWDYLSGRASRFFLLEQLLCPVCFEHSQGSIKDSLNIFCLTDSLA